MRRFLAALALAVAFPGVASGDDVPLGDWAVPGQSGVRALSETSPLPFIGLTPCRVVDTRGGAPLGGGVMTASIPRNYALAGQCGVPAGAAAISLNVTVVTPSGPGYLSVWPQGGTQPIVSTLNYTAGVIVANAAVVPIGSGGGVSFACMNYGCDLVVDTNGYYSSAPAQGGEFDIVTSSTLWAIWGHNTSPTCTGVCGVIGTVESTAPSANAVTGQANGSTAYNIGVAGQAAGTGGAYSNSTGLSSYSVGVRGSASNAAGNVAGVWGSVGSTAAYAAGVVGTATSSLADGGLFLNTGSQIYSYLATGTLGLVTNGAIDAGDISGTSLSISGLPKNFVSPHPLDPSKEIVYAAIEGPSADVFFRGTSHLVNGSALVQVPEHFRLTAREDSYMATVTALGERATLWVESQGPDGVVVKGTGNAAFNYVVYAERDETRDQQPVRENVHFTPQALRGKGGRLANLPARTRALLVRNGILDEDGSFNEATARRLGWTLPPPEVTAAPEAPPPVKP